MQYDSLFDKDDLKLKPTLASTNFWMAIFHNSDTFQTFSQFQKQQVIRLEGSKYWLKD